MNNADPKRRLLGALVLGAVAAACGGNQGSSNARPTDGYVVERRSEGGVEKVRTVSGSRWGGDATLVETLAIGEEVGDQAYLFGQVGGAWSTEERIYLIDTQVPAVRAFDSDGRHLHDIGRPGQGPGEYGMPAALAVTSDGHVIVTDVMGSRLNIYGAEGELIEDWPLGSQKSGLGLVLSYDDEVYAQLWDNATGRFGMQAIGPDGPTSEPVFPPAIPFEPQTVELSNELGMIVPFSPDYTWAFAPAGEMIAGVGNAYAFEIHSPDGRAIAVEHARQPTPVAGDEADFFAAWASGSLRAMDPELGIGSADIPKNKPAFMGFYPDRAGRLWVIRQGPGRLDRGCVETEFAPPPQLVARTEVGTYYAIGGKGQRWSTDADDGGCWTDTFVFDLFDTRSGEFLGSVAPPEDGFRVPLFADEDTVLASVMDEAGTVRLKRYRLEIH